MNYTAKASCAQDLQPSSPLYGSFMRSSMVLHQLMAKLQYLSGCIWFNPWTFCTVLSLATTYFIEILFRANLMVPHPTGQLLIHPSSIFNPSIFLFAPLHSLSTPSHSEEPMYLWKWLFGKQPPTVKWPRTLHSSVDNCRKPTNSFHAQDICE